MVSLILATACSASIALLFKVSSNRKMSRELVTTFNYLSAVMVSAILIGFNEEYKVVAFSSQAFRLTLMLGSLTGGLFLLSFLLYQESVKKNGASMSGMFAKLGILVPMLISIILWKEMPTGLQTLGIFFALIAIVLVNTKKSGSSVRSYHVTLMMALFLAGGFAEFSNKIFQKMVSFNYRPIFLLVVFMTAFALSVILLYSKRSHLMHKRSSVIMGIMVGIPNLFSSYFLLDALNQYPASIVFPTYSAGSILLITLVSSIFFKEHIKAKEQMALGFTAVGLILMNLQL